MVNRPINRIILEGPDLSGKSTFYNQLHKRTNYRWNIQDRSSLSMLVHARQYGRNTFTHVENLKKELFNLNNVFILLLPSWEVIMRRFTARGDEIQNLASLKNVYDLFQEAADDLSSYPNFVVIKEEIDDTLASFVTSTLKEYENATAEDLSKNCVAACQSNEDSECIGLNFTLFDNGSFDDIDQDALAYEPEVKYYQEILTKIDSKINKEIEGNNEYSRKETQTSRRFIYTSDTCISLAHFLVRDEFLDCKFFLRSSNVKDTLYYDINFLKHLSFEVYKKLKANGRFCRMSFVINSGHILDIITSDT